MTVAAMTGAAMTGGVMTARACWIIGHRQAEIRHEPLAAPTPGSGAVLVRSLAGGISRGTERLVFEGRVPATQAEVMRCPHQDGGFPWPVKYGYATVGRVEAGPPGLVGRPVFALHPHQDRFVLPAEAVLPVPDGVPVVRAVLAANLETAINATWDAPPLPGMRIAVVGAGTVGGLVAMLAAAMPGVRLAVVDTDPARADVAARVGAMFLTPPAAVEAFAAAPADLVYHASGHPDGLATALALAGAEATVAELSWYGDRVVPVRLGDAFHARRLRLVSSQVGQVAPAMRPRWRRRDRLALALSLLADPRYDAVVTPAGRFEDLPAILARLDDRRHGGMMPVIRYHDETAAPETA